MRWRLIVCSFVFVLGYGLAGNVGPVIDADGNCTCARFTVRERVRLALCHAPRWALMPDADLLLRVSVVIGDKPRRGNKGLHRIKRPLPRH